MHLLRSTTSIHRALVLLSLCLSIAVKAIDIDITDVESIKSAASKTAYGSMTWYSGNETGQIPGAFPDKWWEGAALFTSLLLYWHYTGDDTYNPQVRHGMQWQAGNGDYMPSNYSSWIGNDDQVFWGLAAMTAAEIKLPDVSGGYSWLALAQGVFNTQVERWDTENCGGGLRWQIYNYEAGYTMKNTISNAGLFQLAARLARYTDNSTYAEWANTVWDWCVSSPLLNNETWNVADSTNIEDGCSTQGNTQWTYNYGAFLAGAAYMYNYTEKATWKTAVDGLLGALIDGFFPTTYGGNIMQEICEPNEACNNNEILFRGLVSGWLGFTALLVPSTYDTILTKLQGSAEAAAKSCSGMSNNTCGVRWYESKWDGWVGMEEQIIATDVISSVLIMQDNVSAPVTSTTGGNSSSDPSAGTADKSEGAGELPTITTGDRAGAIVLTIAVAGGWLALMGWMVAGGGI
ncbi:glycosyl hydrolase family 76-domain-containing protein [Aspergillus pseudodeflectus]|uniref:Mannan endo-1,6-alpha-mannosidase n=1 Tax=Aspergillus pseudodeflectus TaxID=176178 RepID=A0ABR4K7F3_9EURO